MLTISRRIKPDQLSSAIDQELTLYHKDVTSEVKRVVRKATRSMVKETKEQRFKQDTGAYRKAIASRTLKDTPNELETQWYVKAPHYRLSHLLEFGHATVNGGRTVAYGFIGRAEENVIKMIESEVEEAIKNG